MTYSDDVVYSTSPKDGVIMMSLGSYSNVWLRLIDIQVVKGLLT